MAPGTSSEYGVAVHDRLWVGRECAGVDDAHRLLLDDGSISRRHLEISLEPEGDRALVTDFSTNGTLLNGGRIERAAPVPIAHGDRLRVGPVDLEFRSNRFLHGRPHGDAASVAPTTEGEAVLVVGDVVGYAAISERPGSAGAVAAIQTHFGEIRELVPAHRGLVSNYVGGAFLAVWDHADNQALRDAVTFALAASRFSRGPSARYPDGSPIEMGWAVVKGEAAITVLSGGVVTAMGEPTNRAFCIAGLAGRDDRATVLATVNISDALGERLVAGAPEDVPLRGRSAPEPVQALYAVRPDPAVARSGG